MIHQSFYMNPLILRVDIAKNIQVSSSKCTMPNNERKKLFSNLISHQKNKLSLWGQSFPIPTTEKQLSWIPFNPDKSIQQLQMLRIMNKATKHFKKNFKLKKRIVKLLKEKKKKSNGKLGKNREWYLQNQRYIASTKILKQTNKEPWSYGKENAIKNMIFNSKNLYSHNHRY